MCTLILLLRQNAPWTLRIAANRDEMLDRPWDPPGQHWPAQPDVTGGRDRLAGGTWLAVNSAGVVAGVLNRTGALGPQAGRRSRGDLPLLALREGSAAAAAAALARVDGGAYRAFNLIVADASGAFFLRGLGAGEVTARRLPDGLHMVTAGEPDDVAMPRIARHRPKFDAARPPAPPDWGDWPALLGDAAGPPEAALNVRPNHGFGTASATLIASGGPAGARAFRFAAGPPDREPFADVAWPKIP
jgi:uncharacterized protein with NRDE domain